MSGHSHWAGIKRQKEATDQKRGAVFSKLLRAVSVAARAEPNPDFNPRLRTAIEKARAASVPAENIERAVKRASEPSEHLDELTLEAYGPGGAAILVDAITDNRNRTIQEVKRTLADLGGKWAEAGSVRWAFELAQNQSGRSWQAKFPQELGATDVAALRKLVAALEEQDDVQTVATNLAQPSDP
jgi:YebC/PmpR family DNA-binding regulatory protein